MQVDVDESPDLGGAVIEDLEEGGFLHEVGMLSADWQPTEGLTGEAKVIAGKWEVDGIEGQVS